MLPPKEFVPSPANFMGVGLQMKSSARSRVIREPRIGNRLSVLTAVYPDHWIFVLDNINLILQDSDKSRPIPKIIFNLSIVLNSNIRC